jgi:hypothetical protein
MSGGGAAACPAPTNVTGYSNGYGPTALNPYGALPPVGSAPGMGYGLAYIPPHLHRQLQTLPSNTSASSSVSHGSMHHLSTPTVVPQPKPPAPPASAPAAATAAAPAPASTSSTRAECVVCLSAPSTMACIPCGHQCLVRATNTAYYGTSGITFVLCSVTTVRQATAQAVKKQHWHAAPCAVPT